MSTVMSITTPLTPAQRAELVVLFRRMNELLGSPADAAHVAAAELDNEHLGIAMLMSANAACVRVAGLETMHDTVFRLHEILCEDLHRQRLDDAQKLSTNVGKCVGSA